MPGMAKTEKAMKVGSAIRQARKQRGKVMRHIAEHLKTDVAAVGNWETGRNLPSTENLLKVAEFLGADPTALGRGQVILLGDEPAGDASFVSGAMRPPSGPRNVERLGVVAAGKDGDFEFNGEVAELVVRPPGLMNRPRVFALEIISGSMSPRYEKGWIIYCDDRPPSIGDDVVIEMFPSAEGEVGQAFVKTLRKRTKSAIVVSQFNPPSEMTFDPYAIQRIWRVIPNPELYGL